MSDYRCIAVFEAVSIETTRQFVEALKKMDSDLATRRLHAIIQQFGVDDGFLNTASRFISIKNVTTSVD